MNWLKIIKDAAVIGLAVFSIAREVLPDDDEEDDEEDDNDNGRVIDSDD